ncbi:MAG: UDP-N-acetylmuramate--L-alanine ligase [Anaerolineaceae bacterium]
MEHVHFIGIGGTGLSAIARLLLESGYTVSGSDRSNTPLGRDLAAAGVQVSIGHAAENIRGADVIVRSSAVPDDNPEVIAARQAGIPVLKRSAFLGRLMQDRVSIAIAGTHGKTTTTAMVSWVFSALGEDPSYIIGGVSKNLGNNAHAGKGKPFIIEADEYDRMFLGLEPNFAVINTMEYDHPDCFSTPEIYRQAFIDFIHQLKPGGHLFVCRDNPGAFGLAGSVLPARKAWIFGLDPASDYHTKELQLSNLGGFSFKVIFESWGKNAETIAQVHLQVPGEHNVRNALATLAICHQAGLDTQKAADALSKFTGAGRRFDVLGEANGITIVDDYAHHPTEIQTTLAAARNRFSNRRLIAVWQPHTYTRTLALLDAFCGAFQQADLVFITEIYAAREKNPAITGLQIIQKMGLPETQFLPSVALAGDQLLQILHPGDVLLVLSAGDADQISKDVLTGLQNKEVNHG